MKINVLAKECDIMFYHIRMYLHLFSLVVGLLFMLSIFRFSPFIYLFQMQSLRLYSEGKLLDWPFKGVNIFM